MPCFNDGSIDHVDQGTITCPAECGILRVAYVSSHWLDELPAQTPSSPTSHLSTRSRALGNMAARFRRANFAVLQAREDTAQARAARLPSVNAFNQFIYTQGNGTPSGVFVANDGVHIYNEQAVVHQELLALVRHGEVNRALAAEAIARAKVEVAARGLSATVIQDYYAIVSAQRKASNLADAVSRKPSVFSTSRKSRKKAAKTAHADVIKAQIDLAAAPARSERSAVCQSKKPRSPSGY